MGFSRLKATAHKLNTAGCKLRNSTEKQVEKHKQFGIVQKFSQFPLIFYIFFNLNN